MQHQRCELGAGLSACPINDRMFRETCMKTVIFDAGIVVTKSHSFSLRANDE